MWESRIITSVPESGITLDIKSLNVWRVHLRGEFGGYICEENFGGYVREETQDIPTIMQSRKFVGRYGPCGVAHVTLNPSRAHWVA